MARYGNTQALILDEHRGRSDVAAIVRVLQINDYSTRNRASCQTARQALLDFRNFPNLFGERKFASRYPMIVPTRAAGILDLPPELRIRIYRMVLGNGETIETLPHSTWPENRAEVSKLQRRANRELKTISRKLALLRVNKQINQEASAVVYGENRFRFSGRMGWVYLRAFMDHIGEANAARLRFVTVSVPWHGRFETNGDNGDTRFLMPCSFKWLYDVRKDASTIKKAYHQCMGAFNAAGVLRELNLLLDFDFEVRGDVKVPYFNPKFYPNGVPRTTLIHCRGIQFDDQVNFQQDFHETQHRLTYSWREILPQTGAPDHYVDKRMDFNSPKCLAQAFGWDYEMVYGCDRGMPHAATPHIPGTADLQALERRPTSSAMTVLGSGWLNPDAFWRAKHAQEEQKHQYALQQQQFAEDMRLYRAWEAQHANLNTLPTQQFEFLDHELQAETPRNAVATLQQPPLSTYSAPFQGPGPVPDATLRSAFQHPINYQSPDLSCYAVGYWVAHLDWASSHALFAARENNFGGMDEPNGWAPQMSHGAPAYGP